MAERRGQKAAKADGPNELDRKNAALPDRQFADEHASLPVELRLLALGLPLPRDLERPKGGLARVLIIQVPDETGGDKLLAQLLKDSAKARKRAEIEKRAFGPHNLARKQTAETERKRDLVVFQKLCRDRPELKRASREKQATEVQQYLAHRGIKRSVKSIRLALPTK
jgi:hypothetical protein